MATQKKLPTRRDRREAEGYLTDLFDVDGANVSMSITPAGIVARLLGSATDIKVQRATDRLVLYFDLNDDESGVLPAAETDAEGNDTGGERTDDRSGLSEFQKGE